ncbi:similar to Saccharomyces cerevisiae YCR106W RDS1 Zinc cluster transcription factor involved in conferring resistance to cycloheximide [Maudiozyma saulgeensis]|uniref:Similar to Saccharomyces cerevisiae YCR106W RDS1 Zinc cluster transcription factor involved in conferring resistance to cycloheximide n=1 Tax=Maudiozyma saulgeensis TaxID=1789683 RepID=A0A1X7RAD7_9SACH|nr:similar to Saccharomyces cerevisiae YCR106W RDS1 Zinc cluster transcription factor involved in conferring resistance to cycloheximide [Kazachstania saulgeensis]
MEPKSLKKQRIPTVCLTCKSQKLRCDRIHPQCSRCKRNGRECSYDYGLSGPPTVSNQVDTPASNASPGFSIPPISPNFISNIMTDESSTEDREVKIDTNGLDEKLEMWDINKQFLSHGYHTYVDLPYATHSIAQHDPYLRLFCPSVHGTTLTDLQSRLEYIKASNNNDKGHINSGLLKTVNEISPLMFIEDAVVKWVAKTTDNVNNQLPWEYFNTIFTIEDRMHPSLVSTIKKLITEIELLLPQKNKINKLLKHFYQNIYPFYPLIEIPLFESDIRKILIDDGVSLSYTVLIFQENIRERLESLTLFLIIICLTLRDPNLNFQETILDTDESGEVAKKLLLLSQKILSLLNGFKYTTENILCCSLYLLISEILNPGNAEEHISHNSILTLKCLTDMAYTLGLHEEPSQFIRYFDREKPSQPFFMYRRKLWIGLQSLRLEIITADGGCRDSDFEYLETFINNTKSSIPSFIEQFNSSTLTDRKIFVLHDNEYQFHMLMNKVMVNCGPQCKNLNLYNIFQAIERLKEFTFRKFPLSKLLSDNDNKQLVEVEWRGACFNFSSIEKTVILRINLIFFSSLMNIFYMLSQYFEKKCCQKLEKYQTYYHQFVLQSFDAYLELTSLVKKFLDNEYRSVIMRYHEYCLNKSVAFIVIKIQSIQLGLILRICYKYSILRNKDTSNKYMFLERSNMTESIMFRNLQQISVQIKKQIYGIINSTLSKYGDTYFGCYQVMLMGRYVHYIVENEQLVKLTNDYWRKASETNEIPSKILDMMKLKWGLGPLDINIVLYYTTNPLALTGFNNTLLDLMKDALEQANVYDNLTVIPRNPEFSSNEQEVLQQLLQSNFELFSGVIGDSLGSLPTI